MHSIGRRGRIAAVAATPLIAATLLAGCASGGGGGAGGQGSGPVTITVSNWNDSITPEIIGAFEDANSDIKLDVQSYPGDGYSEKITTMIAGNNAPDVMLLFEADAIRLAAAGQIDPLDQYLEGGDLSSDDFIPAVADLAEKMDGTYGLPWCYAAQVLYYNKDLFDAAGVEYPTDDWTWDDYREAAVALTSGDGGSKTWGADSFSFPGMWYSLAGQAGDEVIDGEGNLVLGDGLEKALEFTNELTNADKVQPQPAAGGTDVTDLFAAGKAAMSLNGSWAVATYKDSAFNWDIAPMPSDETSYTSLHTGFYTISEASDDKDAAWTFIEFMMSEEGQSLTSIATSNPSAIKALSDSPDWQHPGEGGPTNFAAITDSASTFGRFGYTLASPTTSANLGTDFNSYLLGAMSLDDVMNNVEAATSGE